MDLMRRRREIIASQQAGLDTSPIILANDKRYRNLQGPVDNTGTSITAIYDLPYTTSSNDRQATCYGIVPSTVNYIDGVANDYWNQTVTNNPESVTLFATGVNQASFTLQTSLIDDSFVIMAGGHILFAGKNTQYYGHRNISELSE